MIELEFEFEHVFAAAFFREMDWRDQKQTYADLVTGLHW